MTNYSPCTFGAITKILLKLLSFVEKHAAKIYISEMARSAKERLKYVAYAPRLNNVSGFDLA